MSTTEQAHALSTSEQGLVRSLVVGGLAGFLLIFVLTAGGLAAFTTWGVLPALGAGAFTGAFGGIGFGAMVGGSLHHQ